MIQGEGGYCQCGNCGTTADLLWHKGHSQWFINKRMYHPEISEIICKKCDKIKKEHTKMTEDFEEEKKKEAKKREKKKKGKKDELKDYEKKYLKRLGIITPDKKKILSDSPEADKIIAGSEEKMFQDIHILTREEVEKARAEIEIIKIREPHRQSQKTIPTQATILNAGSELDDCYIIFGIDQHITCDELKKQFRELSAIYNSSKGRLQKTKEENEIMEKVHTRINQAYTQLYETHKCGDR